MLRWWLSNARITSNIISVGLKSSSALLVIKIACLKQYLHMEETGNTGSGFENNAICTVCILKYVRLLSSVQCTCSSLQNWTTRKAALLPRFCITAVILPTHPHSRELQMPKNQVLSCTTQAPVCCFESKTRKTCIKAWNHGKRVQEVRAHISLCSGSLTEDLSTVVLPVPRTGSSTGSSFKSSLHLESFWRDTSEFEISTENTFMCYTAT